MTPELITFGQYLAGEFENQRQAQAEPVWYVHLRLWLRPLPLFREDSIALFAEQASIINLDQPYRPRLWRLMRSESAGLEVRHYMFNDLKSVQGAGKNPDILRKISLEDLTFLPTCTLSVKVNTLADNQYQFIAQPQPEQRCQFTYEGTTYQVALGFEVTNHSLKTYDKGLDPSTGKGIWGALLGPYQYEKKRDFSAELDV
ncbi:MULTISPECIES: chromophore lyase CpcT/CpeT [unclassified Microcystis]|uniref:chromophore lyase CpcT/CpeT n=1 Tax=unclassified Microcystis TaxID=2643300 RepID=UPI0022C568F6|nr:MULTISPECIES: chromophore lyase CpcT/CpeT [unclassified Microcystis]MCA2694530.1 chromophore lyase CpcT/CpeT [Microcystis sp. M034S2]MCA2751265.1 chromophore lyase CpcT/CpeT [Microcystis sp. M144S2]MCZ8201466.1 chromophore lyase CpcT/CpeT [Microcystis sp. LE19-55.1A]MCZ8308828.1 chromophore lyase CpcT/CpeT [Microcystis sp. LE19-98.1E]